MLTRRGKEKSSSSLRTGGRVSLTLAREPGLEGSGRESSFRRGMEDMASWWWMCLLVSSVTRHLLSGREKMWVLGTSGPRHCWEQRDSETASTPLLSESYLDISSEVRRH